MAATIRASEAGLEQVDRARRLKQWAKQEQAWYQLANTSESTLKRFWAKKPIDAGVFESICKTVDIEDWQAIADLVPSIPPSPQFPTYNPQTFTGRKTLIVDLLPKLQKQTRLLWISGISGIGKTALAECLASQAWENNPSFQWIYLDILEGQSPDFASVAADLLAKLGERDLAPQERNNPEQLAKRLLQKLQSRSYWIQLDSLERLLNPEQPTETEFTDSHWLAFFQHFLMVQTLVSRLVLTAQALPAAVVELCDRYPNLCQTIALKGLSANEQDNERSNEHLALFRKNGVTVDETSSIHLQRIGQIYEGHPLVLQVIAREMLASPFDGNVATYWQRYGNEFEQVARELQSKQVNPALYNQALQRQVRRRVESSLQQLPPDALALLCRSSVYRRPVPETFWLEMINNCTPQQQRQAYQILDDRALIEKEDIHQNCFLIRQHNLIRAIAYDRLKTDTSIWKAAERQAAHLWLTAYEPGPDATNLETVRAYLEAFNHYCEIEDWEQADEIYICKLALMKPLYWQLLIWGYYKELIEVSRKLVDRISSPTKRHCLNQIGNSYSSLGNIERSIDYYQKALQFTRDTGDRAGESAALGNLGSAYKNLGQYEQAIDYHQKNLIIAREINDRCSESNALSGLGVVYNRLEQYEQAIDYHKQHLTITQEIGNRLSEGNALSNLGVVYYNLAQYEQAIDYHKQHLTITREIGHRRGEGIALVNIGEAQLRLRKYPESLKYNQAALEIFREVGDRTNEAEALKGLAELHHTLGEIELAKQYCQQVLALATELGIPLAAECQNLMEELEKEGYKS